MKVFHVRSTRKFFKKFYTNDSRYCLLMCCVDNILHFHDIIWLHLLQKFKEKKRKKKTVSMERWFTSLEVKLHINTSCTDFPCSSFFHFIGWLCFVLFLFFFFLEVYLFICMRNQVFMEKNETIYKGVKWKNSPTKRSLKTN